MCGIVGEIIFGPDKVKIGHRIRGLLNEIQHRGHESAGITLITQPKNKIRIKTRKEQGEVVEAISSYWTQEAGLGWGGIGRVRYSTSGSGISLGERSSRKISHPLLESEAYEDQVGEEGNNLINCQPFYTESHILQRIALVHNGNLINADKLKQWLRLEGISFEAESDTEVILLLIRYYVDNKKMPLIKAIQQSMKKMSGSYSCILLTKNGLYAFRDPLGFRPLKIAKTSDSYIFASEPCAWHSRQAKYVRNVLSGEIVEARIGDSNLISYPSKKIGRRAFCIFEEIYLQAFYNFKVALSRYGFGEKLFASHPLPGIVIPVMNSGEGAALGYHATQAIKYPGRAFYFPALYKNPRIGRTFLEPNQADRIAKNKIKYFSLFRVIESLLMQLNKTEKFIWIILIDDSLIRANVSSTLIEMIRSDLKTLYPEIHTKTRIAWLLSSPPYAYPCYFGIDTYNSEELIAANKNINQIRHTIGADYLGYLNIDDCLSVCASVHKLKKCNFCTACFSGKYPIRINPKQDKMSSVAPS